jgi:hypothetical protein
LVPDLSLKTSSQSETINKVTWEWRRLNKEELYALQIPLTKHYPGDQIKEKEVDRLCETHGETEEVNTGFWWGDLRERNHLEDLWRRWENYIKWMGRNGLELSGSG